MSWGNPETTGEHLLAALLKPASAVYGLGAYVRLVGYGAGWLERHKIPVPVVSIGNLTCGGTGKTPIAVDFARRLTGLQWKVAILSRGYRRKSREELVVVSDGKGNLASCADSGDEPYMMARAVPEAVVIVSARRALAAEIAVKVYDADVIVLDDGFQHLAVVRDHDVVLIDYGDQLDNDLLLPAGRLREPVSALTRADWIVITKVPQDPDPARLSRIEQTVAQHSPDARLTRCRFAPYRLSTFGLSPSAHDLGVLAGAKVVVLCAIARPQSFIDQLRALGAEIVRSRTYRDHHWWSETDIELLRSDLRDTGAQLVLITEKDAARLEPELVRDLPIYTLDLRTEWLGPVPVLSMPLFGGKEADAEGAAEAHEQGVSAR